MKRTAGCDGKPVGERGDNGHAGGNVDTPLCSRGTRERRGATPVLFLATALLCTACPNPNTYTTPRTAPAGKINHSVAVEGFGFRTTSNGVTESGTIPTFPTYTLRVGATDRLEVGARVANMSSLGADLKYNPLRSKAFDLAIDPGFQAFFMSVSTLDSAGQGASSTLTVLYLHAPLLLGFNVADSVSIVLSPGITYGLASASFATSDSRDAASSTTGILGRLGLGFDFRLSPRFALHPEVTFLRNFESDPTLLYLFGLGFNFGNLPQYGAEETRTIEQATSQ